MMSIAEMVAASVAVVNFFLLATLVFLDVREMRVPGRIGRYWGVLLTIHERGGPTYSALRGPYRWKSIAWLLSKVPPVVGTRDLVVWDEACRRLGMYDAVRNPTVKDLAAWDLSRRRTVYVGTVRPGESVTLDFRSRTRAPEGGRATDVQSCGDRDGGAK